MKSAFDGRGRALAWRVGMAVAWVALGCAVGCGDDVPDAAAPANANAGAADAGGEDAADVGGGGEDADAGGDVTVEEVDLARIAPYFDLERVLEVEIELEAGDWDALRAQTRTLTDILGGDCMEGPQESVFTWFPAAVVRVDGEALGQVGVRKKGFLGSLSDTKPSLKLRFDRYVEGQRLGGAVERMTLNNVQQDLSKLNTCLAYKVFADAGVPAPRCNFATVTVNGEPLGLYVHVEELRRPFLRQHFADADGALYEGTLSDFRPVWSNTFELKTGGDPADRSAIEAVVQALDEAPGDLGPLEAVVDVERFLTFWAAEALVGHWDGYSGNRNNFFVYSAPGERLAFIPWGADATFRVRDEDAPEDKRAPQSVMAHGAIAHRLYQDAAGRARYVARLRELLDTVWDEDALLAYVDRMEAIVQAHARPEALEYAAWDTERLRAFVRGRRGAILAELEPSPPEWEEPLGGADICWEALGSVDLGFEAEWGTLKAEDPFREGTVAVRAYDVEGARVGFLAIGAVAGFEVAEDGERYAVVQTFGFASDQTIEVIWAYIEPERMVAGSFIPFDIFRVDAIRAKLSPPDYEDGEFSRVTDGGLFLEAVGTAPGDTIRGRLYGDVYSFGGYTSGSNAPEPDASGVVINEVAARGEPLDWFELHNTSAQPVDLSGFVFADDLDDAGKRVAFVPGTVIAPGGYARFWLDKDAWPGFALGSAEALGVWNADGALVDSVSWSDGDSGDGASFARIPDATGDFQTTTEPTPGAPNR